MRLVGSDAPLVSTMPFKEALFMSPDGEITLKNSGCMISLPVVDEGGVVVLR